MSMGRSVGRRRLRRCHRHGAIVVLRHHRVIVVAAVAVVSDVTVAISAVAIIVVGRLRARIPRMRGCEARTL